jgi:hypothetical protein
VAYFLRITICLLAFISCASHADTQPAQMGYGYGFSLGFFKDAYGAHCTDAIAAANTAQNNQYSWVSAGASTEDASHHGYCMGMTNGSGPFNVVDIQGALYCPTGWTLSGSTCTSPVITCTTGEETSAIFASGCFDTDGKDNGCDSGTLNVIPSPACDGSCNFSITSVTNCDGKNGSINCLYAGLKDGSSCTPSDQPPMPPTDQKCPAGYVIGYVNGKAGCYSSAAQQAPTTTKTTSTSGDVTTTTETTVNNQNNTTTTITTTVNNSTGATSSSGTTTATDPTKPVGDTLKPPNNDNYCKDRPADPLCAKVETQFTDTCDALPPCQGDAVQCAQAQAAWQIACAVKTSHDSITDLGSQIVAGNDPLAADFPQSPANTEHVSLATSLDQTELFTAQCPPDLDFNIGSRSVHVSLSNACTWLNWIGNLMVMACLVSGMIIVGKD